MHDEPRSFTPALRDRQLKIRSGQLVKVKTRSIRRRITYAALVLVCGALMIEAAARIMGLDDFPLYNSSDVVGYIPAPNQTGAFRNRYRWVFNDRSMGTSAPFEPAQRDVLVVGDSIVLGGNQVDQSQKLGPALGRATGCTIWPLGADSWGLLNELREIKANPDFLKVGTIVFVSNSADFGAASTWWNTLRHPRSHPASAAIYAARKYFAGSNDRPGGPPASSYRAQWEAELAEFFQSYRGRVVWVIYPQKAEMTAPSAAFGPLLTALLGKAEPVLMEQGRRWNTSQYKDYIHPTAAGTEVLAGIIAERLHPCR